MTTTRFGYLPDPRLLATFALFLMGFHQAALFFAKQTPPVLPRPDFSGAFFHLVDLGVSSAMAHGNCYNATWSFVYVRPTASGGPLVREFTPRESAMLVELACTVATSGENVAATYLVTNETVAWASVAVHA